MDLPRRELWHDRRLGLRAAVSRSGACARLRRCGHDQPDAVAAGVDDIAREIEGYVIELGSDGRLVALQLEELVAGIDKERVLVLRDYVSTCGQRQRKVDRAIQQLDALTGSDLLDLDSVARVIGFATGEDFHEQSASPRGYRMLAHIPRLPETIMDRLVVTFGSLQRLLCASLEDLQAVEGVGESRVRSVRDGLSRLAESGVLDRHV